MTLLGSNGERRTFRGQTSGWLQGNRVVPGDRRPAVHACLVCRRAGDGDRSERGPPGAAALLPGQDAGDPRCGCCCSRRASRCTMHCSGSRSAPPCGSSFRTGASSSYAVGSGGEVTVNSLPRGDYRVSADALGISSSRPVALSGDQRVELRVISWLDIAVVLLVLGSVALGLLYVRRPARVGTVACAVAALLVASAIGAPRRTRRRAPRSAVRLLLHLVQRAVVGPGQDRLPRAGALLERRPGRHAPAHRVGEAGRDRRLHRELEEHARPQPAARAAGRRGRLGALQAARDLPGARLLPRAAARGTRRARPRLVPRQPRRADRLPGVPQAARDLVGHMAVLATRGGLGHPVAA